MNKLTREQIKIIAAILIVVAALACFWAFIYLPQGDRLKSLQAELAAKEFQIEQIKSIMSGKELSVAVGDLNKQLLNSAGYLSQNQEDVIAGLSDKARALNVEINGISPQKKTLLEGKVSGYALEELSISLTLTCTFKSLGEYLDVLRGDFPFLIRIKHLQIKGDGEGKQDLRVNLEILAYLSKKI